MAYINIQNVELNFSGTRLFDSIGLNVEQGERVALIGRNGSGKSSLLRLIEGSIKPDAGNVSIQKGVHTVPIFHRWCLKSYPVPCWMWCLETAGITKTAKINGNR